MYEVYNSVTKREYDTARDKDIPIFIFVDRNVRAEYETFKSNRQNSSIRYAHVDSVNIFRLLDDILSQKRNNYVKEFDKFEDITSWLREQWAGIFADMLARKRDDVTLKDMSARILELNQVTNSLKEYTQSILKQVDPNSQPIIEREEHKERSAKILRLKDEALIRYILENSSANGRNIRPSAVYMALEQAKTLDDFVERLNFPEAFEHGLLGSLRETADLDFGKLRQRYFDVDIIEPDQDLNDKPRG